MKLLLILLLLLLNSCGSSGSQDYHIKLFAVNVSCEYAAEIQQGIKDKLQGAGVPFTSELAGCIDWPKSYEFGESEQALADLRQAFGAGHYLLPRFSGLWFDGVQIGDASLSVAVEGRLKDSVNQASHEVLHQFGAGHNLDSCNIMGFYRSCDNPPILDLTLREIGIK
jgi:hypothetical protein